MPRIGGLSESLNYAAALEKEKQSENEEDAGLKKIQATVRARMAREKFLASKESAITIQSGVRGLNTRRMLLSMMKTSKQKKHSVFQTYSGKGNAFATSMAKFKQEDLNSVTETLAQAKLATARKGPNTERLHGQGTRRRDHSKNYAATKEVDRKRKLLLRDARRLPPIDAVLRVDKYGQTVLFHLVQHPATWIVLGMYAATAVACRNGQIPETTDLERDAFESGGVASFITFMVVFYVGYCYNRYSEMFADLETVMREIINCCSVARCCFKDKAALYDLWRFLNLLHVTAYCGVTVTYNRVNLCDEFCNQHGLLTDPALREKLEAIDLESPLAWSTCMVWALEVVEGRATASPPDFAPPIHKEMNECILAIGAALSRIYAKEYQVLPYIYTHLISFSCVIYLVGIAFLKGLYFTPEVSPIFGLVLPLVSMLLLTVTVLGLVIIGALLANPLGSNRESFAVCHFLNYTCTSSLEAVSTSRAPTLKMTFVDDDGNSKEDSEMTGKDANAKAIEAVKDMIEMEKRKLAELSEVRKKASTGTRRRMYLDDALAGGAVDKVSGHKWQRLRNFERMRNFASAVSTTPNTEDDRATTQESFVRERLSQHESMLKDLEIRSHKPQLIASTTSKSLFSPTKGGKQKRGRLISHEEKSGESGITAVFTGAAGNVAHAAGNVANAAMSRMQNPRQKDLNERGERLSERSTRSSESSTVSVSRRPSAISLPIVWSRDKAATVIQKIARGRSARENIQRTARSDRKHVPRPGKARIAPHW